MRENISNNLEDFIKLIISFTILNRKFNEMNLIRHALKLKEQFTTESLHYDYREMINSDPRSIYFEE